MNILKKLILLILAIFLLNIIEINTYASPNTTTNNPVKIAVFLLDTDELFLSHFSESLKNIQKENGNKVQFTVFDSERNQGTENDNIAKALDQDFDLFVIEPVTFKLEELKNTFDMIHQKNIPFILLTSPSREVSNFVKEYLRTIIIGGDDEQSGILQGKLLINEWNTNKTYLDHNKDNIVQYVILKGPVSDPATDARSKYPIQTLNEAGIKTQAISSNSCNWDKKCARDTIESIILTQNGKTEVIIANSDDMAVGAVEALQKYGYNKGNKSKYIPVVGVGGLPEATELIKQGSMTGTVIQDPSDYANAVYSIGMNIVSGQNPLNGTNYKFDETGNTVRIPYKEYSKQS
ncbi:galactose ABC transporter substrate-binding protein [Clostridium beijerinckii]|uniref:galactose ABC transporter substrate-binding protein n=1 Tax=Clostridium beijerinckii TaxID=1520 RepID=UPI00098CAECF|nr:galactose ABC transporter substrate-binding protein [Clostridium beijerinckii]NRT79757.1 methyl-galactoside transport system substrate-binding protein [Clostridium beijerinckii]OOM49213.1 D-galactose-binding periplasmic protein precursor [Clostridium beijerinckii]